jgi:hypothetical protein
LRRRKFLPGTIENGNKVECRSHRHTVMDGRHDDVVQWNEHTPFSEISISLPLAKRAKPLLQYKKKLPVHIRTKLISLIGPRYWLKLNGFGACRRYEETVKLVMMSRPRMRKAHILMVQPKPTFGSRWTTMIGKMTPPNDEPAIANPPAIARLLRK